MLEKLTNAEVPDESSRLSSQSNSSQGSSCSENTTINSNNNNNNDVLNNEDSSITATSNHRSSTHSGSQADSGYPGDSNNSLAAELCDEENIDGASLYDNVDNVDGAQAC